ICRTKCCSAAPLSVTAAPIAKAATAAANMLTRCCVVLRSIALSPKGRLGRLATFIGIVPNRAVLPCMGYTKSYLGVGCLVATGLGRGDFHEGSTLASVDRTLLRP